MNTTRPTLQVGDIVNSEGVDYRVFGNSVGYFFGTPTTNDKFSYRASNFWNPIHEALGVTPRSICIYPNYITLEDLSKVVYHVTANSSETAVPATPAPGVKVKPKRTPRRKEGIPESTYRWRKRSAQVDDLSGQVTELRDLLQTADFTNQDLNAQVAEGRQWRTRYQELSKGTEARVENLEEQVALYKLEVEKKLMLISMLEKDLSTKRDLNLELQDRLRQTALENGEVVKSLHIMTQDRDGLLGQLTEAHLEAKSLVTTSIQVRNESAQARRDAWSATYKLENFLATPWRNLIALLTKRKG